MPSRKIDGSLWIERPGIMKSIEVERLVKVYDGRAVVAGISFTVEDGEVFGLLGPDGAGKTTTVRILTGQIKPTSGRATIMGLDVAAQPKELKTCIGVVSEYQGLYEWMSVQELLEFSAHLCGVNIEQVPIIMKKVGLNENAGMRIQRLSYGMKQRLMIGRALIHQPRGLFLDEPTRGLGPGEASEVRILLKELADSGVTIFFTTHYGEEAEQLCQRVALVNEGRIAAQDSPERLKSMHGKRSITVCLKNNDQLELSLDREADRAQLARWLEADQILNLHSGEATLDDVFLHLTGRRLLE
jgi:ABC-2 type transport system ATP-binding protein